MNIKQLIIVLAPIIGLLTFGTINSNVAKLVYEIDAPTFNGTEKLFRKPFAMTTVMFTGMIFSLVIIQIQLYIKSLAQQKANGQNGVSQQLVGEARQLTHSKSFTKKQMRDVFLVVIPAFLYLLASVLMNEGLLSVTASVYQMLRGSGMLFAAFFAIFFLKRKLNKYNFIGLGLSMGGIILVGLSSILSGSGGAVSNVTHFQIFFGMFLIVLSQCIQAAQITFEDFFISSLEISSPTIVGYEGMWGMALMFGIFLPLAYFLPGKEGDGVHENTLETFYMIGHSGQLAFIISLSLVSSLGYNLMGVMVTGLMGAVFRTVLETMRTLLVWATGLIIYYSSNGRYGEEWTPYSFIQLAGFVILAFGTLTYAKGNKIIADEARAQQGLSPESEPLIPTTEQEQQIEEQVPIPPQGATGEQVEVPSMTRSYSKQGSSLSTTPRITYSLVSSSYQEMSDPRMKD